MSLSDYKKKRKFDKTPEPAGSKKSSSGALRFVVQKHDASRLHYDFRLELRGVLVSWAVPKGPSLNPKDKRLAMKVEDHPLDYKDFEGIIPQGNYGAGTVIVWDEGTYSPANTEETDLKSTEKLLMHQLYAGNLKIILHGKKLKGEFALVLTRKSDTDRAWLMIKKQDKFSSETDITRKDKSVVSGLTIERVAKTSKHEWQSNRTSKAVVKQEPSLAKKSPSKASSSLQSYFDKGQKETAPENLKPMLATLVKKPFDGADWIFEVKWDGYRALAKMVNGEVTLESRNRISFNDKFKPVTDGLKQWNINAIVDGEVIVMNESGMADFQLLQSWQKTGKGEIVYYLFDVLWVEGYNVMELPLIERKELLKAMMPPDGIIRYSDHVEESGKSFYDVALKQGLEGIMAKEKNSVYIPSSRSQQWLKVKTNQVQEAVIAGFTEGRGGRQHFGALILGIYVKGVFTYIGHTGSGMDEKSLASLNKKLTPLITGECPFRKKPKTNMAATWVKPELVCEVKFQEWTKDNILRIPIFLHLRTDKKPVEIHKEESIEISSALKITKSKAGEKPKATSRKEPVVKSAKVKSTASSPQLNGSLLDKKDKEKLVSINGHELKLTNLDKFYWPVEKYTKRDLLNYYHQLSSFILSYMKDRPQSMNRHPQGITGIHFYQKDVKDKVPDWFTRYEYLSESTGEVNDYLVCTDEASLLYMANLGCIEMNPWHSRISSPDKPDWCVIDLDPDNIAFEKVIETALVVKKVLDSLKIISYCKTSGSRGMHIYIPLGAKYSYDQSRQLAELIVNIVHGEISSFTSIERNPRVRKGKIYLDYLQNRSIQTIAAPYSLRPKPGATVSTPLHWDEVKPGLAIGNFTIGNIMARLKTEGDLFVPVLGKGIDLSKVLKKAATLFK